MEDFCIIFNVTKQAKESLKLITLMVIDLAKREIVLVIKVDPWRDIDTCPSNRDSFSKFLQAIDCLRHPESFRSDTPCRRLYPLESYMDLYSLLHPEIPSNGRRDLHLQHAASPLPRWRRVNVHAQSGQLRNFLYATQPSHYQSRPLKQISIWRSCSYADPTNASSASRSAV